MYIRQKHSVTTYITMAIALIALIGFGSSASASNSSDKSNGAINASTTAKGNSQVEVAAVIKGLDNPFFQSMAQGIKDAAASFNASVTIQAARTITDTVGQADKLNAMAGQDYACYIVNPITGTNLIQGIAKISRMGKPIVNIDFPVNEKAAKAVNANIVSYIGTDNVYAGKLAGQIMTKMLSNGGKVAVIGGTAGDVTSHARIKGFKLGLGDNIEIVQIVSAKWKRAIALTRARTILQAHPNLSGFFVANDDMALGVVRAVTYQGKSGQVHVVSVDGIKAALKSIKAGGLDATVSQYPYAIGKMGMEACLAAVQGKKLPDNVKAPIAVITQENVSKALANFPKPFKPYDDPFAELLK